jgi:hypothetical protein
MVKSGASNAITYAGVTQFIISSASSTASMEAPVDPNHIVGWWPLNGDTNDYSGNNNNGAPTAITYLSQYGK